MKILALAAALLIGVAQSGGLKIVVIEGEGAVNIIQQKTAVSPLVEVRDRNNNPVSGAVVTFTIQSGNSAAIAGGAQTLTVTTNAAGRAAMAALNPVNPGTFQIQVQAAFQGQTAAAAITQTNVMTAAQAASATAAGAGGGGGGAGGGGISGLAIGGIVGGVAVAGAAVVATGALGGEEVDAATQAAAGTYTLVQINGASLPALTVLSPPNPCPGFTDSATLTLTTTAQAGALSLTISERSHIECSQGSGNSFNGIFPGQWSLQGATITLAAGGLNPGPGTLNGSTIRFAFDAPHFNTGNPPFRVTSTWQK
jgi:hypothetical protein